MDFNGSELRVYGPRHPLLHLFGGILFGFVAAATIYWCWLEVPNLTAERAKVKFLFLKYLGPPISVYMAVNLTWLGLSQEPQIIFSKVNREGFTWRSPTFALFQFLPWKDIESVEIKTRMGGEFLVFNSKKVSYLNKTLAGGAAFHESWIDKPLIEVAKELQAIPEFAQRWVQPPTYRQS